MAKAGMRRPSPYDSNNHGTENREKMHRPKNEQAHVTEIQGAAKNGNDKAGPINAPNWARDDYKTGNKREISMTIFNKEGAASQLWISYEAAPRLLFIFRNLFF